MGNLTRNGVCYDLERTPFYYDWQGYRFYFSSHTHERNFYTRLTMKCDWMTDSMSRRFHFRVQSDLIAVFQLYEVVETRGFRVLAPYGKVIRSCDEIRLKVVDANA